ncbi:hypothetical protein HA402_005444 [Bradysia odoriphaga]|nr:hypothetical protein HA402_005444 [Bradysia odoriphaga]
MTATDESNIGSLVSTSPSSFGFDVTPIEDINELTGDLFPNSPKQFYEDDVTDSSKVDEIRNDTHATNTETTTDNHITPDAEPFDDRTVEKLRISLPSTSPIWSSCYSSSSESTSSNKANKIRKRFCVACNQRFRKTSELHRHLLTHVTQPSVQLERLSQSNRYYQDFLKRQSSEASEENTGFKIKLKVLSGAQNFEVIPNALDEANRGKGIRILTAKEIKLSPNRSPSTNASPLDAMVALSEMTFSDNSNSNTNYMTDQDKLHFECPTLDGLDQFNEEVNKEAAAQLLKQLLETPQMPQENEWTPTNEYISIDRLAHMCPVCHSNFPDAVMLYEHKRITGHDFQNLFQQQQQQQQQSSMPNNGMQRPFLRPRAQTQLGVYGQPQLHQPNQNQFSHHQQPQQGVHMQQQDQVARYGVRLPMRPMAPQRRTPPPLYRPNGQAMPQGQPLNMAPFMGMSPDMYNPMPGANGMNNNTIMNSNAFPPNSRISPLQRSSPQQRVSPLQRVSPHLMSPQQQQQMGAHPQQQFNTQGMMRPPINMNMMRQMRPGPPQPPNQMAARQPLYTMRRAPNGMMIRTPITQTQLASHLRPRLMGPPAKKVKVEDGDDCEVISMQPRTDGLPVIHSVQGGANASEGTDSNSINSTEKPSEPYQLSEITLSVKGKEQPNKNPKEVANILAHRGITVTSSKPVDQREKSPTDVGSSAATNVTAEEAVQKIQLNSSVSIIQKKKPTTTIDLSNDDDVEPATTAAKTMTCPIKDCNEVFASQDSLNRHMQRGHKTPQLRINRCRLCPAKFSSAEGLIMHQKKVHRVFKTTASELGLPVVDLRNEQTRTKLASLGIYNYIPLSHLNRSVDGVFGLPIVSVQGAANQAVCNLAALGADSLLSIGPVKAIPKNPSLPSKPTES